MNTLVRLNSKTALEHLIFLNGKNIIEVCRAFDITPQQFSDWIKKRRPIPDERLEHLSRYFNVPKNLIADENRFTKSLSVLSAIELELIVVANKAKLSDSDEEKSELAYRKKQLNHEYQNQLRIAKLSALLDRDDPVIMAKIDAFLAEIQ